MQWTLDEFQFPLKITKKKKISARVFIKQGFLCSYYTKNQFLTNAYSQVPIKRVGPNKRVGWVFYVNLFNK